MSRRWLRLAMPAALLALALAPSTSLADRRYFVNTYTPYLAPAGTLESELWTTALAGRGDSTNTAWANRAEFEYAITDRMTGAFYLNYQQSGVPEAPVHFEGPSIELIYALAERGRVPLDPALYLELRENGDELELEPKLLLAKRRGVWVGAVNAIGEIEFHQVTEDGAPATEKVFQFTGGLTREYGHRVALGLEGRFDHAFVDARATAPTAVFLGPTLNLQSEKVQLAIGWQLQLWGAGGPAGAKLNVDAFARSELRLIFGIDL